MCAFRVFETATEAMPDPGRSHCLSRAFPEGTLVFYLAIMAKRSTKTRRAPTTRKAKLGQLKASRKKTKPALRKQALSSSTPLSSGRQPLASEDLLRQVKGYVRTFGCRPSASSPLGKAVHRAVKRDPESDTAKCVEGLHVLQRGNEKNAIAFINSKKSGKKTPKLAQWAANMRFRAEIAPADLSMALQTMVTGKPRAAILQRPAVGGQAAGLEMDMSCAVPTVIRDGVPLTPRPVVNWVYQALLDIVRILTDMLGEGGFDSQGRLSDATRGLGEVVLWWGTHIGSVRDQGMIAWDYDGDLAVFVSAGVNFDDVWAMAKTHLEGLGYAVSKHGVKYRVCPVDPICWAPYTELYQQVCESNEGMSRGELRMQTSKLWRNGVEAKQPHGSNCIDIECYSVKPGSQAVTIRGTNHYQVPLSDLFPTAVGVLGPLQFRVPRTRAVLKLEYGHDVMSKRWVKKIGKGGVCQWEEAPSHVRRCSWPTVALSRCPKNICRNRGLQTLTANAGLHVGGLRD